MTAILERPMTTESTPAAEQPRRGPLKGFEELLRATEELDTPDGYKAELIRGKIVVSPWSRLPYLWPMRELRLRLEPHAPKGHIAETSPFLFTFPSAERAFGPDGYHARMTVPFGKPLTIPVPFDFELDTNIFLETEEPEEEETTE